MMLDQGHEYSQRETTMRRTFKNSDEKRELRGALGQFPTGVAIVTALTENHQPLVFKGGQFQQPGQIADVTTRAAAWRPFFLKGPIG